MMKREEVSKPYVNKLRGFNLKSVKYRMYRLPKG